MSRLAGLIERIATAARKLGREGAAMVAMPLPATRRERPARRAPSPRPVRRKRPRMKLLEQTVLDLGPERPRWTFSRLVERSPHKPRMLEYLEFTRKFFPELDGVTVHVGLAQKRGVLGWGSMDPEKPGVWIRPRRLSHFTIAHEFTHLLQARGLVPHGERACDLHALARTSLLVDHAPSYLRLPRVLHRPKLKPEHAQLLTDCARRALAAKEAGDRRYLQLFEKLVQEAVLG
jgi:hypothetical protein